MTEYGDFANLNPDKLLAQARQRLVDANALQGRISSLVGEAQSKDGYVKATYTSMGGLDDLELNPRAMRVPSADLAATIKQVIKAAADDLRHKMQAETSSIFNGTEDPVELMNDPEKIQSKVAEMQSLMDNALGDAVGQMEKIRKQLGI